jgi:hypothetical protein
VTRPSPSISLKLPSFDFNSDLVQDPDPAFHFNADEDLAPLQNDGNLPATTGL